MKTTDIDSHAGTVTLHDQKGHRAQARLHVPPLTDESKAEIDPFLDIHRGGYVLSSTNGSVPIRPETLSNALATIAKAMLAADELSKAIRLADLRRTIETVLAAAGISMEVRAQLQSHGLGAVQNRHYDRHRYMDEKLNAMKVLYGQITSHVSSTVLLVSRDQGPSLKVANSYP